MQLNIRCAQKSDGGPVRPAIGPGCVVVPSEKEFQSQLQLPGALGSGYPAERALGIYAVVRLALVERTIRGPAAEGPDGIVEGVEGVEPELEKLAFRDMEFFLQAQVNGFQPWAANVADAASAESVGRGIR